MNIKEMKRQSRLLHDKLNQKNDYRMSEVIRYLRGKDLSSQQIEMLRLELLEKANEAEELGKPAESAFNYDYRAYIDELVETIPPMAPAVSRYESFRLWGILILVLLGISISRDLISHFLGADQSSPLWSVNGFEAVLVLLISGVSAILTSLFSRHKLERDPDFFSKKAGNLFGDFIGTYGLSFLWMMFCLVLIYLFKDTILLETSFFNAGIIFLIVLSLYGLILTILKRKALQDI